MTVIPVSCSCCKNTEATVLYSGLNSVYTSKPYSVAICTRCSNGITYPTVNKAELNQIYSETYLYPVHLLALGEKKYRARAMANFIKQNSPANTHPKVLEVGCMFGYLLQSLQEEYKVKGIDIGRDAVKYCRNHGLDVDDMSIENFIANSNEKFDVIVLSHVLEHLLKPDEVMLDLQNHLNPGGMIYILVPNYKSISPKIFGKYWGWWQVPVHINHFNEQSLSELANSSGYKKTHIRIKGGDSLMLLLNFINLFSFRNNNKEPGFFQKMVIGFFTKIFRYWYLLGNEELTIVLKKKQMKRFN
ncbi:MAG: class I SAM-dependent methyltransferase [Bacteroidetes bacterium]|nr:MAG: class I SAM-dependent methyltransferase [Bacteroidota bacterium]